MVSIYLGGRPKRVNPETKPMCDNLSNAIDQSRNRRYSGSFVASNSSWILLRICMGSPVDLFFLNPNCVSEMRWSMEVDILC